MRIIGDKVNDIVSRLQDSSFVGQFQSYFGIEITHICKSDPKKLWIPIEVASTDHIENIKHNEDYKGNLIFYKVTFASICITTNRLH